MDTATKDVDRIGYGTFEVVTVDEDMARAASLTVCAHARGTDDARGLLIALGLLTPAEPPAVRVRDLVTIGEAARRCGRSDSTVRAWVYRGALATFDGKVDADDVARMSAKIGWGHGHKTRKGLR